MTRIDTTKQQFKRKQNERAHDVYTTYINVNAKLEHCMMLKQRCFNVTCHLGSNERCMMTNVATVQQLSLSYSLTNFKSTNHFVFIIVFMLQGVCNSYLIVFLNTTYYPKRNC